MTKKEQLKNLIEDLPDDKIRIIEVFLNNLVKENPIKPPKGNLGLKKPFSRADFYDELLVDRH